MNEFLKTETPKRNNITLLGKVLSLRFFCFDTFKEFSLDT